MTKRLRFLASVSLLVGGLALAPIPGKAAANLVVNGSFEQGFTGWGYTYNFGVGFGFPSTADGANFGEVYGTIYQDLPTIPGQQYHLRFALAGNFNISDLTLLNVRWDGPQVGSATWNPAGHNINDLGWVWTDLDLIAGDSSTRLTFENPYVGDSSGRIPRLDAITVMAVPEPSMAALIGVGAGVALLRRGRRVSPGSVS